MKKYFLHICLIAIAVPFMGMAQQDIEKNTLKFYTDLAERDASNEQGMVLVNEEDHQDFWKDQNDFEMHLRNQNLEGYTIYLKRKGNSYRMHEISCNDSCNHSEEYYNKASFYKSHSQLKTDIAYVLKTKKPRVKD